jgi:hypothetical protein
MPHNCVSSLIIQACEGISYSAEDWIQNASNISFSTLQYIKQAFVDVGLCVT